MNWIELIILLIIAGICGAIGQALGGTARGGLLVDIALGFIGALFGLWMARGLHLPELLYVSVGAVHFPVFWSIIGAAIFMALLHVFTPRRSYIYR